MNESAEVVICGAGIAGVATAYFLTVEMGLRDVVLVDERAPLSLTSDKSTECYRNWWPGPGDAMVAMMNRSIDLLDELARRSNNLFHINRRGYIYASCDPARLADLEGFAQEASSLGAGEVRRHDGNGSHYQPAQAEGFEGALAGADLLTDSALIQQHFPYLSPEVAGLLHVRRAGWLSAQQLGAYLLAEAKAHGARLVAGHLCAVDLAAGRVAGVELADGSRIQTSTFVDAAGPLVDEVAALFGVKLPVFNELHLKAAFNDVEGVVARQAPMLIFSDEQTLDWSEEERAWLAEEPETRWLTERLPSGAHARPEGGSSAQTLLLLWDFHNQPVDVHIPPPLDPEYPELALRGLLKLLPGLEAYLGRMPKPYLDGGYYTKTDENRPLACPTAVPGAYVIGAMSGYGIMAAAGLGELLAAHITGGQLPDYAPAFDLARYQDPAYQALLADWGSSWQL